MTVFQRISLGFGFFLFASAALLAQGANVAFGGLKHDASQPVEITADELTVDQTTGSAVFIGNVVAGQGDMRLSAARVQVQYAVVDGQSTGDINQLIASGGVTLVNGAEAAEAQEAVYTVASSQIVMTGDVILTQGPNALSGEKLTVDLNSGQGRMTGRVKTIFQTGGNQ
jgi:lipopolysaccharide export system protein LptA